VVEDKGTERILVYGIAKKMTRPVEYRLDRGPVFRPKRYSTGRAAKAQRSPSINKLEIRDTKSETNGKLKILISKHLKTREKFSLEGFEF